LHKTTKCTYFIIQNQCITLWTAYIKNHWLGLLNAFDSRLTNGRVEAINSLIQAAKAKTRGYGTTKHL